MLTLAKHPTMKVPKKRNPHSLKQTQNTSRSCFWLRWCSACTLEDLKNPTSVITIHSSVHMAHSKSPNNLSPSLFFHSLCIRSSLHSTPCRPHRPFLGPLASVAHSIHGGARGEELLHDGGVAVVSRVVQRCPTSGAEGLGDVNGWRAPPRGSPPPTPHCSGRNCNLWSEVREFHVFQNCIASWLNGSHYLLLVFVTITKTAN